MNKPNLVFYNLQNSGSSALDPIFREILGDHGYLVLPFGPEASQRIGEYVEHDVPIYHWTHDPTSTFKQLGVLGRRDWIFVVLHRDYRDVAVSFTKDMQSSGTYKSTSNNECLLTTIRNPLPEFVRSLESWLECCCRRPDLFIEVRFDQMQRDMTGTVSKILDRLDVKCDSHRLRSVVEQYSFERMAARQRGDEGPPVRTGFRNTGWMYRKGISGDWKNHFNVCAKDAFNDAVGDALYRWRWESSHAWGTRGYHLVSAPFSSGVAWLGNVLLELGIRVTHRTTASDQWERIAENKERISDQAFDHLQWHFPILSRTREFEFREDIEVIFEHRLDFIQHPERPVVLYVRDPRDAIYSLYRRNYAADMTLQQFLERPSEWPDHFPGMFHLPPTETWAYFHLFWLAMRPFVDIEVVHFEKMRESADAVTHRVLSFLGLSRAGSEVARALHESGFDKARSQMERVREKTGKSFATARKGQIGEWREVYSASELSAFEGPCRYAMEQLGYTDFDERESPDALYPYAHHRQRNHEIASAIARCEQYIDLGDLANAMKVLQMAIALDELSRDNQSWLASIVLGVNWLRAILPQPKLSMSLSRRIIELFAELNMGFRAHGPVRSLLERAISVASQNGKSIVNGLFATVTNDLRAGNLAGAEQNLRKLIDDAPGLPKGYLALSALLVNLGRRDEAIRCYQRGVEQCLEREEIGRELASLENR